MKKYTHKHKKRKFKFSYKKHRPNYKHYGGVLNKNDFAGLIMNSGRVGSETGISMFINSHVLKKAIDEVSVETTDNDDIINNVERLMNMYLDYLHDIFSFVEQNGSGYLSPSYYDNTDYDFKIFRKLSSLFIDSIGDNSSYSEFVRILVNIHLSGLETERSTLLTFIDAFVLQFKNIYFQIEGNHSSIKQHIDDYLKGTKMNRQEKKTLAETNRFHQPTDELIQLLQLLKQFIVFLKNNPVFITYGVISLFEEFIPINIFKTTLSFGGPTLKIQLTKEKHEFNHKYEQIQLNYSEINGIDSLNDTIYKIIDHIFITYKNNNLDTLFKSKLENTSDGVITIKKNSTFYKGVSKENHSNLKIENNTNLLFYYIGFDPLTAAVYSVSNTTLDDDRRTYNSQKEFCEFSAGYVGEFQILNDLKMLDFKNITIYSIVDTIADNSQLDAENKANLKKFIRKILIPSPNTNEMIRISNYSDDYAFMTLLCNATDFDGYVYALNSQGTISDGLNPEIVVCNPYGKISVISETPMRDIFLNCSNDLSYINPYLFSSVN